MASNDVGNAQGYFTPTEVVLIVLVTLFATLFIVSLVISVVLYCLYRSRRNLTEYEKYEASASAQPLLGLSSHRAEAGGAVVVRSYAAAAGHHIHDDACRAAITTAAAADGSLQRVDGHDNNNNSSGNSCASFHPQNVKDAAVLHTTRASRYALVSRIGEGAFSSVYLVRRKDDGKEFALKYIICASDKERLAAVRECETINSVQGHPSIIKLVDMFMNYNFQQQVNEAVGGSVQSAVLLPPPLAAAVGHESVQQQQVKDSSAPPTRWVRLAPPQLGDGLPQESLEAVAQTQNASLALRQLVEPILLNNTNDNTNTVEDIGGPILSEADTEQLMAISRQKRLLYGGGQRGDRPPPPQPRRRDSENNTNNHNREDVGLPPLREPEMEQKQKQRDMQPMQGDASQHNSSSSLSTSGEVEEPVQPVSRSISALQQKPFSPSAATSSSGGREQYARKKTAINRSNTSLQSSSVTSSSHHRHPVYQPQQQQGASSENILADSGVSSTNPHLVSQNQQQQAATAIRYNDAGPARDYNQPQQQHQKQPQQPAAKEDSLQHQLGELMRNIKRGDSYEDLVNHLAVRDATTTGAPGLYTSAPRKVQPQPLPTTMYRASGPQLQIPRISSDTVNQHAQHAEGEEQRHYYRNFPLPQQQVVLQRDEATGALVNPYRQQEQHDGATTSKPSNEKEQGDGQLTTAAAQVASYAPARYQQLHYNNFFPTAYNASSAQHLVTPPTPTLSYAPTGQRRLSDSRSLQMHTADDTISRRSQQTPHEAAVASSVNTNEKRLSMRQSMNNNNIDVDSSRQNQQLSADSTPPQTPLNSGFLCLVMEHHPMGDLSRYVLRIRQHHHHVAGQHSAGASRLRSVHQQTSSASPSPQPGSSSCALSDTNKGIPGRTPLPPPSAARSSIASSLCTQASMSQSALWLATEPTAHNPLPEPQLLSIAYQLASVLEYLHVQSPPVVHRDLKPENILIKGSPASLTGGSKLVGGARMLQQDNEQHHPSDRNNPEASSTSRSSCSGSNDTARIIHKYIPIVVTDFGLAMLQEQHRRPGRGGGTRPYVAPECWRGKTSTASDLWSLGCVLYALATSQLTTKNVKILSSEAARDGFATMVMNDIIEKKYSLAFASFVLSLLVTDPLKRPTASMAKSCFKVVAGDGGTPEEVAFDTGSPFFTNVLDL